MHMLVKFGTCAVALVTAAAIYSGFMAAAAQTGADQTPPSPRFLQATLVHFDEDTSRLIDDEASRAIVQRTFVNELGPMWAGEFLYNFSKVTAPELGPDEGRIDCRLRKRTDRGLELNALTCEVRLRTLEGQVFSGDLIEFWAVLPSEREALLESHVGALMGDLKRDLIPFAYERAPRQTPG